MINRNLLDSITHDAVVRASAETYVKSRAEGYEITINAGSSKNRFVGPASNPSYPDVIVWKPSYVGSTEGTAVLIEEIETKESVNYKEAEQWRQYSQLMVKFLLIVPYGTEKLTKQIVDEYSIRVDEVWSYYFDNQTRTYKFVKSF